MSKANSQTMTIRVPTEIAKELFKLRDTKNVPTVGSALKVWIDEEINRARDAEVFQLRELIDQILAGVLVQTRRVNQFEPVVCEAFQELLGKDHKWAKELREATNCKGCPSAVKSKK